MKRIIGIMTITLLLTICAGGVFAVSPANAEQAERHAWQGELGNKIPVSVWFEIRNGLITGELVYTNTKEKKPIRLLGTVAADGNLHMQEMLPTGAISGIISGKMSGDLFEGTWKAPDKLVKKGNSYEEVGGKSFSLRLTKAALAGTPFRWEHAPNALPNALVGNYQYSYGKDRQYGALTLSRAEGEGVQCTISSYTDAPAHNQAYLSFAADASSGGKGRLQGNHIVYEEDTSCAVEILLFSDFAVVRYLEGKRCNGWFGMNATVEGIFLRQKEK